MSQLTHLNLQRVIDDASLSFFQWRIFICCFLIVAVDGFDTAAIGFIAPSIRNEWELGAAQLSPLFGAGLLGLALGALIFGPLADRWGRKVILQFSVVFFGLMSLFSAWSPNLDVLIVLRFLTGVGLGGAMPNTITLTSEYLPSRYRAGLVTLMFCGFTLGSASGGMVSAWLLPLIGWQGILILGGVMPLAIWVILLFVLKESPRYLVMKNKTDVLMPLMEKLTGQRFEGTHFYLQEGGHQQRSVSALFQNNVARISLLLWTIFFMGMLIIYLLSSWLPTLLHNTGIDLAHAAWITTSFQIGGTLGSIVLGQLMDRLNPYWVLCGSYAMGALFIVMIGLSQDSMIWMAIAVFGTGIGISGSQVGMNALAAQLYPTSCRATGVSWANGIGRSGAILGSLVGGVMISMALPFTTLFMVVALPAVAAAVGIAYLNGCVKQSVVTTRVLTVAK